MLRTAIVSDSCDWSRRSVYVSVSPRTQRLHQPVDIGGGVDRPSVDRQQHVAGAYRGPFRGRIAINGPRDDLIALEDPEDAVLRFGPVAEGDVGARQAEQAHDGGGLG